MSKRTAEVSCRENRFHDESTGMDTSRRKEQLIVRLVNGGRTASWNNVKERQLSMQFCRPTSGVCLAEKTHLARTSLPERQGMLVVGQHVFATHWLCHGNLAATCPILPSHQNNADPSLILCSGNLPGYRQARTCHNSWLLLGSYHDELLVYCSRLHKHARTPQLPACESTAQDAQQTTLK